MLKEDKQEINLSQVIYGNKKLEKVKALGVTKAKIIIVSRLNLIVFVFRFFFIFNLSLFYIHYSPFIISLSESVLIRVVKL